MDLKGELMAAVRLQKLLARAGVASRRACEEIIAAGRVTVDGRVVTEPGAKADPEAQDVRLDGSRLRPERPEYWLFNKPEGVVCTNLDPSGRPRPIDFMRQSRARLFPVGRLDADSRGALLMTNDGEFANRLAHPRFEVPKTYLATVVGKVTGEDIRWLVRGVYLSEGRTGGARVRLLKGGRSRSLVEVTIRESRNRQVRRVLARLGHGVRELVRTRIGRVTLRGLSSGESRRLTPEEVADLTKFAETPPPERSPVANVPQRGRPRDRKPSRFGRPERGGPGRAGRPGRPPRPERRREGGRPPEGVAARKSAARGMPAEPPHPFEKHRGGPPAGRGLPAGRHGPASREGPRREGKFGERERGPSEGRPPWRGQPRRGKPHRFDRKERGEGKFGGPRGKERYEDRKNLPTGRAGRSHSQHDTDGVSKTGARDRHDARGGRGGRRGRRDGPPSRGRRPGRHPPQ